MGGSAGAGGWWEGRPWEGARPGRTPLGFPPVCPGLGVCTRRVGGKKKGAWGGEEGTSIASCSAMVWKAQGTCLVHFDPLWKPFGCLFHDFLIPCGTFWTPRANFFGPRDDSGHIASPGRKKLRKNCKLAELWPPLGSLICDHFGKVDDFSAACFLLFFWVPSVLTNCRSGVHLGSNLRCFSVYLGPLEIGLKR